MQKRDVIIIGGGPAGRVVVHALHSQKKGLSITLIKDEDINENIFRLYTLFFQTGISCSENVVCG